MRTYETLLQLLTAATESLNRELQSGNRVRTLSICERVPFDIAYYQRSNRITFSPIEETFLKKVNSLIEKISDSVSTSDFRSATRHLRSLDSLVSVHFDSDRYRLADLFD